MRYIVLFIGTVLSILFIIHLIRGAKYVSMFETLDSNKYMFNTLYVVGYSWSKTKFFPFQGKLAAELMNQASMLYEPRFAKYYAIVTWSQAITLAHLFAAVLFLLAGCVYSMCGTLALLGVAIPAAVAFDTLRDMKKELDNRTANCERELPEVVSSMAILVNSGMMLRDAWYLISERGTGDFYSLMRKATGNMRNGMSDKDAIFLFGRESNSLEIKKFSSALIQSMEKTAVELSGFLAAQSSELWNVKQQTMLQEGEKASAKLLLPIMLIFVGVILIVIAAAFGGSLF